MCFFHYSYSIDAPVVSILKIFKIELSRTGENDYELLAIFLCMRE